LGAKKGLPSTSSQDTKGISIGPSAPMQARMTMPWRSFSHFFAIAPAATRTAVSRADERPPPRWSRRPYFCR